MAPGKIDDVEVDETHVYWVDFAGEKLWRRPLAGGEIELVVGVDDTPALIARSGGFLYFAGITGPAKVQSVPREGGEARVLHVEPRGVWSLAADEEQVYWTTHDDASKAVYRKPVGAAEGDAAALVAETGPRRAALNLDESAAYYCVVDDAKVSVHRFAK